VYTFRNLVRCLWLLFLPAAAAGQPQFLWQFEPEFSYTRKLADRWTFNVKPSVQQTFNEPVAEGAGTRYQINYTQVQLFGTYKIWTTTQLSGGYSFRFNDLLDQPVGREHRIMEQIAFVSFLGERRLAHRIRTEQRFQDQEFINRWRYRLAYEFPLQGERLDPGEKYLITSNEVLFSFNAWEQFAENRLYLGIGWYFSNKRKIEAGLQYRLQELGTGKPENAIWFTTAYYLNQ
jgi:hypothetical protein